MTIHPINTTAITPELVLHRILADVGKVRELYVVTIDENDDPYFWSSGSVMGLSHAAMVLQEMTQRSIRGELDWRE